MKPAVPVAGHNGPSSGARAPKSNNALGAQEFDIAAMPPCFRTADDRSLTIVCAFNGSDISRQALEFSELFVRKEDNVWAFFCSTPGFASREVSRIENAAHDVAGKRMLPNFRFEELEAPSEKDIAQTIVDWSDRRLAGLICTGTRCFRVY